MTKRYSIIVCAFMAVLFFNVQVESNPVKGYNSYIELLPGGKQTQMINFEVVGLGQDQVIRIEKEKREREIKFDRPVDVFDLNSKYFMIAFDISYKPKGNSRFSKNPAVFALIFEKNGTTSLKKYSGSYIKWIGSNDIQNYTNSGIPEFCEYFRRTGVEDCIPDPKHLVKKKSAKPSSVKRSPSGTQSADPNLVRRNEFDKVIKAKDKKIEKLSFVIDKQNETTRLLTNRIKNLEIKETLSKPSTVQDVSASKMDMVAERISSLEKDLSEQTLHAKELEKVILSLSSLLDGVSRNKNDLTFSGVNLKIVNGSGSTDGKINGTGNLIVGYNEKKPGERLKEGSHNIIAPDLEMISKSISDISELSENVPEKESTVKTSGLCFIETVFF